MDFLPKLFSEDGYDALVEQKRVLSLIVNNIGDGLLVVDHSGRLLLSNPAAQRMLGLAEGEKIPEECSFYRSDKVQRIPAAESPTSRAIRGEPVDAEEIFVRHRSDHPGLWAEVTARPLRDDRGMIHGAVAVLHDINVQKQAEVQQKNLREERAARMEAEAASKAKDRFLAMLGHELRTPLTPVLASVDLLEQNDYSQAATQSALTIIRRNVQLEARLIDDILDLSAINKGKMNLNLETVDAHSVLQNACSIFQAEIERRRFQTNFQLGAAEHFVTADSLRLLQVFWNLIKNAIKFTPDGGKLSFVSRNEGGKLMVDVSDNGAGIESELLPRVFESFEQGERHLHEGHGGLGLGLAISKGIVDAHQGELTASSAGRNRGTTFTLQMKFTSDRLAAHKPVSGRHRELSRGERPARPIRILLVDDHKDTVRTLRLLLTRLGYQVFSAKSVSEALGIARAEEFDLLLSDIGLPDGSGLDLMRQLREHQKINGIALSGFGMEEDRRKSREAGFFEHLTKPINLDRLQAAIRQVTSQLN